MREFFRAGLYFFMVIFLVAGCVHNVHHIQLISDRQERYTPSYYSRQSSNKYDVTQEEFEEAMSPSNTEEIKREDNYVY